MTEDSLSQALLSIGGTVVFVLVAVFFMTIVFAPLSIGLAAKLLKVPDRSVVKAIGAALLNLVVSVASGVLFFFSPPLPGGDLVAVQVLAGLLNVVVGLLIFAAVISAIYKTAFRKSLSVALLAGVLQTIASAICVGILLLGVFLVLSNVSGL